LEDILSEEDLECAETALEIVEDRMEEFKRFQEELKSTKARIVEEVAGATPRIHVERGVEKYTRTHSKLLSDVLNLAQQHQAMLIRHVSVYESVLNEEPESRQAWQELELKDGSAVFAYDRVFHAGLNDLFDQLIIPQTRDERRAPSKPLWMRLLAMRIQWQG
jgi:hypothetical protein